MADPKRNTKNIRTMLTAGVSQRQICCTLGVSKTSVSYHARAMGISKVIPLPTYDWNAIIADYVNGMSLIECRKKWGFSDKSWRKKISNGMVNPRPKFPFFKYIYLDKFLERMKGRNTTAAERRRIKEKMILEGILNECAECGNCPIWNDKPLSMHLDHIDGNGFNNTKLNFRLLCPNCHSQTPTYGWRNAGKPVTTISS